MRTIIQPNGKICVTNDIYDIITLNLTEDEYIEYCVSLAREKAKKDIENPDNLIGLIKNKKITDEQLKEIGSEKTLKELSLFIPKQPNNQHYYGRDCTTYGQCPNCEKPVQSGIGGTDKRCKCGQILDWSGYSV